MITSHGGNTIGRGGDSLNLQETQRCALFLILFAQFLAEEKRLFLLKCQNSGTCNNCNYISALCHLSVLPPSLPLKPCMSGVTACYHKHICKSTEPFLAYLVPLRAPSQSYDRNSDLDRWIQLILVDGAEVQTAALEQKFRRNDNNFKLLVHGKCAICTSVMLVEVSGKETSRLANRISFAEFSLNIHAIGVFLCEFSIHEHRAIRVWITNFTFPLKGNKWLIEVMNVHISR